MMNRRLVSLTLTLILVLFCSSLGFAKAKYRLTYSNYFPPTHKNAILGQEFCDTIEKQTNGLVKITYYPGGTITKAPKVFDGVVMGLSDIGMTNLAYTRGRFPVMEALDLPFGTPSGWVATKLANDFYNTFTPKEFDKVHILYFHSCGPNIIYTRSKKVEKLEDLKGLAIRGTGRIADTVTALGATARPISMPEAYEALSKGVIEGVMGPMEMLKGFRTADVTKYAANCWQVGNVYTFYVAMNKAKWNRLPADIQKIFDDVSAQWIEKHAKAWNDIDKIGKTYFQEKGGMVVALADDEVARWKEMVEPTITAYREDMVKRGFKGEEVDSYIKFVREKMPYWIEQQAAAGIASPYTETTE